MIKKKFSNPKPKAKVTTVKSNMDLRKAYLTDATEGFARGVDAAKSIGGKPTQSKTRPIGSKTMTAAGKPKGANSSLPKAKLKLKKKKGY